MGPTYWRNTLTILSPAPEGAKELASYGLNGETKDPKVDGQKIFVEQIMYKEDEPICCPSDKKTGIYGWDGKDKIFQLGTK